MYHACIYIEIFHCFSNHVTFTDHEVYFILKVEYIKIQFTCLLYFNGTARITVSNLVPFGNVV